MSAGERGEGKEIERGNGASKSVCGSAATFGKIGRLMERELEVVKNSHIEVFWQGRPDSYLNRPSRTYVLPTYLPTLSPALLTLLTAFFNSASPVQIQRYFLPSIS